MHLDSLAVVLVRSALLASLLAAAGCAHREAALPPPFAASWHASWHPEDIERRNRLLSVTPQIDHYLADEFAKRHLPNLSFGVVAAGRLVWGRGLGARDPAAGDVVNADTVFRVGSITRVFTGAAIIALRDAGKLDLDVPAASYVPELDGVVYPTSDSPKLTVRHLVTHSSGLPREGPLHYEDGHELTRAELLAALQGLRLEFSPGERSSASDLGMALAGLVIERVSGERYRDFVTRHVLGPLGMTESSFDVGAIPRERLAAGFVKGPDGVHPGPAHWRLGAGEALGGLYSSVTDMAKFMAFELSAWPPRDEPDYGPLRRSSLREAQSIAGFAVPGAPKSYGVGFVVISDPKLGRVAFDDGSTEEYSASMWLLPLKNVGVVSMSGTTDVEGLDELTHGAFVMLEAADKH